ncbi:hypothetical protein HGO38_29350 [Rhizobium sp. CG5]|uniref:hypothetical protein n=1 Tax=Rhizobium sp. CG5 TaxID=2726076 RepID=UPI002034428E|nr:hypothetical protein [Rhizobium sp. CG5]MCM2477559.1 hypothetical protein [Rhizobium sp. CG5]
MTVWQEWIAALRPESDFTKLSANRIRRIAQDCDFPELCELISTAALSEHEAVEAPLDPLTFERFPEFSGSRIDAFIASIWLGAENETEGTTKLRRMRAAYLLGASFLPYEDSTTYALLYGKALLEYGLPKLAIEPYRYAAMWRREGLSVEWGCDALFHLALCQEKLSHSDAMLSCANEYLIFARENDLPDHVMCAILFKSKAQAVLADREARSLLSNRDCNRRRDCCTKGASREFLPWIRSLRSATPSGLKVFTIAG